MMKPVSIVRIALAGAAVVSLVLYIALSLTRLGTTSFDDAYMFLRYAKHWLSGMGFSWNTVDGPAYGITSTLHLFAITAVRGLTKLPDTLVLTYTSFAAALIFVAVMTATGFVFFKSLRKYWLPLLVIPAVLLGPFFVFHSTTGMETTLVLLCNAIFAASVLHFAGQRSRMALVLCAIAAYASFLARPDTGLYGLLLPPLFLLADDTQQWKTALRYVAAFVLLLGADLLFKLAIFGDVLPNSFFAKSAGFYRGYLGGHKWNVGHETFDFFRVALPYLLVSVCFATRATRRRLGAIFLPVILTFAYLATVTQIMGYDSRYFYPSLPFLIMGAFIAADSYLHERSVAQTRTPGLRLPQGVAALLLLIIVTSPVVDTAVTHVYQRWVVGKPTHYTARESYKTLEAAPLPSLGWSGSIKQMDSLLLQLPTNIVLAASESGLIGSNYPSVTIIDLAGLHDRQIARHGFSAEYLFSRKPDLLWFPHSDYTWATKDILDNKTFTAYYDYYPGAYDYGLAVRRGCSSTGVIHAVLEKEFLRIYHGRKLSDYKAVVATGIHTLPGM